MSQNPIKYKREKAAMRARRTRIQMHGTGERPRMSVKRSLNHIYVQLIDDNSGKTLASSSDLEIKGVKGAKIEIAAKVGELIAQKALKLNIKTIVFDRGSNKYHGRVSALANAAREGGLVF
ncbi:MAG: hypothetical protein ACD_76C00094G0024 [uncultured bacterium]|nr:MAG: hypothetical protein ACD_76C00094G0024 [uncultured bacterium]HBD05279.1 50S ribosomal protein L18 [Candidatus Uhrbacteria bacterium]